MSSTAAKVVAGIAIFLTLVLAFVGYRVSRQYAESSERAQAQVQTQTKQGDEAPKLLAVVAVKPLGAYKKIAKDDVVLAEVTVAPRDYFTSLDEVVDKEPRVDIDQGAPLTKRYFAEGNLLAKSVPPGFHAVSVEVTDVIGVGGFVRPGDIVDVLLYLRSANDVENTQARVLLKDTRVLAYEDLLVDRPEGVKDEEGSDRARRQRTAVLAVPKADTTRLMLGASLGELRLALHGVVADPAAEPVSGANAVNVAALPLSNEALQAEAAKKVPDQAYTARQLSRVELPPAEKKKVVVREKVIIYRASEVETVTP
ncbi:MAG: Flp pilus assembly protein CpaB [Panacagrimonas sp.]